MCKHLW